MTEEYLDELNEQQRQAVLYTDGPSLVIAGAGSGKTRVLTYKIVHLLSHGYEPWRILALTFTNKAAREMRARIEGLVGQKTASRLWMGTFHSIFAKILRQHSDRLGFKRDYTIYDTSDSKALIKTIIKDMGLDDKLYKPNTIMSAISCVKNAFISPEDYAANRDLMESDRRARRPYIQSIYAAYRNRCFVTGAMDFDDLLYYTNVLLRDNPDILRHYQEFFRYVLVDEYQDTNYAQHLIVSQLTAGSDSFCMVGDDAQSIYSFRGANIKNILNLKQNYPTLKIFKLEQNYRSTQNIINAANSLIDKNTEQIRKQVFSRNALGSRIEVVQSYSDYEESFLVANRISQVKMNTHDSYDEFAVLYRTNAQSRILEESLRKRNIPYRIYGGLPFYQRKEVKDAIAYFRLSINPDDDEALKRVINNPSRGIGVTTVNKLLHCAIDNRVSVWQVLNDIENYDPGVNSGTKRKLDSFRAMIQRFIDMNLQRKDAETVAVAIIRETGLLSVLITDRTPESISKQENINELLNTVKEFVATKVEEGLSDETTLRDFLGAASLATDQDQEETSGERVTLMTVHAAKGLEFANVFIVGVEEELFPAAMSSSTLSEIEEERRLLYVAITRAKNFCMLSYASSRLRNGQVGPASPSRFIRDINPEYLHLVSGTSLGFPQHRVNPVEKYQTSFHSVTSKGFKATQESSEPSWRNKTMSIPSVPKPADTSAGNYSLHNSSDLKVGMTIEHPRFGTGEITNIDTASVDHRITVNFSNVETKTLLLKFARFNIV